MHGVHVSAQLLLYATRRRAPQAHGDVSTGRGQELAVRTDGDTRDFLFVLQRAKWSAGDCVPEDHSPVITASRDGFAVRGERNGFQPVPMSLAESQLFALRKIPK